MQSFENSSRFWPLDRPDPSHFTHTGIHPFMHILRYVQLNKATARQVNMFAKTSEFVFVFTFSLVEVEEKENVEGFHPTVRIN